MFQSKKRKALQVVITAISNDISNNYKDNAIELTKRLKYETELAKTAGELKPKEIDELNKIIDKFETDLRNFKRTY